MNPTERSLTQTYISSKGCEAVIKALNVPFRLDWCEELIGSTLAVSS
jgi:hypothetical protein